MDCNYFLQEIKKECYARDKILAPIDRCMGHNFLYTLNELSEEEQIIALQYNVLYYKLLKKPTKKAQKYIISKSPSFFKWIENPDNDIILYAIGPYFQLNWLNNSTYEIKLKAIIANGLNIQYVEDPTEEMQLAAVKSNLDAIKHIQNPTEEVQEYVVYHYISHFKYIKNPTAKIVLKVITQNPEYIQYVENQTEEIQLAVVNKGGGYFYIKNPTERVKEKIIDINPSNIDFISNPSKELQIKAIRGSNYNLETILKCPDIEVLAEQVYNEIIVEKIIK